MAVSLKALTEELSKEVTWLHLKWIDFRELFAKGKERVDLLNEAAPVFFGNLQRTLWEDVLLHICRLTDPGQMNGYANLSIRLFPDVIPSGIFRNEVSGKIQVALDKTAFAREWRNLLLAHKDFPAASNKPARDVPPASRADVEAALLSIRDVMRLVHLHIDNVEVGYEHSIPALEGVNLLLIHLKKGVEARKKEFGDDPDKPQA